MAHLINVFQVLLLLLEGLFDNYSHKYDRREFVILYARW